MSCGASNAKCNGECGEGEGDCDNNDDCLDGFRCKHNGNWFGWGMDYCTNEKCYYERSCCKGQCGEGEGDCDSNEDCLPGFECKYDWTWDIFSEKDYCTEEFRYWECDKFPRWLQKTYRIRGLNFCKEQWNAKILGNDELFNSQPKCNDKVLPTISFHDAAENRSLCTLNMNDVDNAEDVHKLCSGIISELSIEQEIWIVYIVHGFTDSKAEWYPQFRAAIEQSYKKNGRKILIGEVTMADGLAATLDSVFSRTEQNALLKERKKEDATKDRANLGPLYDISHAAPLGSERLILLDGQRQRQILW